MYLQDWRNSVLYLILTTLADGISLAVSIGWAMVAQAKLNAGGVYIMHPFSQGFFVALFVCMIAYGFVLAVMEYKPIMHAMQWQFENVAKIILLGLFVVRNLGCYTYILVTFAIPIR